MNRNILCYKNILIISKNEDYTEEIFFFLNSNFTTSFIIYLLLTTHTEIFNF